MKSCKKNFRPRQFLVGGMVFVSANIKGMKRGIRKQFCGDAVAEALCAIGQRRGSCDPAPWDFTEEERFKMFKHLMHSHVYPGANLFGYDGRTTYSWTYSIWTWQHGGKRKFVKEVWAPALPAATRGLAALPGEFRYRIALYDNVYEAVICGGKGGMLWAMLMP